MKDKCVRPIIILLADDSEDDRLLTQMALDESLVANELRTVEDGEELMEYLNRRGRYADPEISPRPGLILLDLNMPLKDGREALQEIKADPLLRRIPVVALTTSEDQEDIIRSYELGVSSFITKPISYDSLVEVMKGFGRYWIEIVSIPALND